MAAACLGRVRQIQCSVSDHLQSVRRSLDRGRGDHPHRDPKCEPGLVLCAVVCLLAAGWGLEFEGACDEAGHFGSGDWVVAAVTQGAGVAAFGDTSGVDRFDGGAVEAVGV